MEAVGFIQKLPVKELGMLIGLESTAIKRKKNEN